MDERTMDQKLNDTALRSEHRTIGHRMSRKVLVIAPTHAEAQRWAERHRIAPADVIYVGPLNWQTALQGAHGLEHVILNWSALADRLAIKDMLQMSGSVPFEGEDVDEPYCTDLVRS